MQPHPLREMFADHSCKNCRYPERGCARYMRLATCQEFQPNDDTIFREIVRLKIAHLRRMADACEGLESRALAFAFPDPAVGWTDDRYWRIIEKVARFRAACLAKITELKGMQCSTKS